MICLDSEGSSVSTFIIMKDLLMLLALFLFLLYWCWPVTMEAKVLSQSNVWVIGGVPSGS